MVVDAELSTLNQRHYASGLYYYYYYYIKKEKLII